MITPDKLKKLEASGLKPNQIAQVVKAAGGVGADRQGASKWLFGNRTSAPGMAYEAASNVLSLPSYAIGGMMDEFQQKGIGAFNPLKNPFGLAGAYSGIKNKEAVMRELPESFGVDPNTNAGMALGFAGELLTPGLPFTKAAGAVKNVFKGGKAASRIAGAASKPNIFARGAGAVGEGIENTGKSLAVKALRPSPSQLTKFEDLSGMKMGDYISSKDLFGTGEVAGKKAEALILPLQEKYNTLVRSGKKVSPLEYVRALRAKAAEIRKMDFSPETQSVAEALEKRAVIFGHQAKKFGKTGIPIDILTESKSSAFSKVPGNVMTDPTMYHAGKIAGQVGIDTLEQLAPGSRSVGKELQALREFQNIAQKQSGLGKGSQLLNFSKLGGFTAGGVAGGIPGAALGMASEAIATNPKFLSNTANTTGKIGRFFTNNAQQIGNAAQTGFNAGAKTVGTALRVPPIINQTRMQTQQRQESQPYPQVSDLQNKTVTPQITSPAVSTSSAYPGIVPPTQKPKQLQYKPPTSTLQTNSPYGKTKQVKRGSFY